MTLRNAVMTMISAASLGKPIAWPGVNFTPPNSGQWLEVILFENEPLQPGIGDAASTVPRGVVQITVCARPGLGFIELDNTANSLISAFPRGTVIDGGVRVNRKPYKMGSLTLDDRLSIPVSIPYSA